MDSFLITRYSTYLTATSTVCRSHRPESALPALNSLYPDLPLSLHILSHTDPAPVLSDTSHAKSTLLVMGLALLSMAMVSRTFSHPDLLLTAPGMS